MKHELVQFAGKVAAMPGKTGKDVWLHGASDPAYQIIENRRP
jgi:hypothetical protein